MDASFCPFPLTSIYILMMEVNPLCDHVTFHPSLPVTVGMFRSVQPICHQTWSDEREGVMDTDADRHGEEEQGWNKKGEAGGLLSKREHMLHRDEVREMELESSHISSCCIILCFDLLSIWCVAAAPRLHGDQWWWSCFLDSPAHFLWRELLVARPLSCLIPISLLLLTLVRFCSSSPPLTTMISATAGCGAE